MTTEEPAIGAVIPMVANPSPVEGTEQMVDTQARVALPLATVNVMVTPTAGASEGARAVTVNGIVSPIGIVPEGAVLRVSESPSPESLLMPAKMIVAALYMG